MVNKQLKDNSWQQDMANRGLNHKPWLRDMVNKGLNDKLWQQGLGNNVNSYEIKHWVMANLPLVQVLSRAKKPLSRARVNNLGALTQDLQGYPNNYPLKILRYLARLGLNNNSKLNGLWTFSARIFCSRLMSLISA